MPIRLLLLSFCFCLFSLSSTAQNFNCGTVVPPNSKAAERMFIAQTHQAYTTCLNKTLSIHFIIVTDSLNVTGITPAAITAAVQNLNNFYKPICMSFQNCTIDTVYSYKYNTWSQIKHDAEFRVLYCKENIINIVLVNTITNPAGALGYAPLGNSISPGPHHDLIVLTKGSIGGKTFPHEMGHFFGLYHTFETSLGVEFVNESNCTTAGDLLCDTPADINPAPVSSSCTWTGTNRDPNNDLYTPMLGNIMSYHNVICPQNFTTDQYNRIIFCYQNYRNYLY